MTKSNIEEMQKIAISRGGSCLANKYINGRQKLTWQCSEKHNWNATPENIKRGKWCPTCAEGLGERICRLYFQKIFGYDFIKVRPSWLKNKTGFALELDGYCEELKIAFEHQGRQHYTKTSLYKSSEDRDEYKRILCKENGIKLIEIPELLTDIRINDLKNVIEKECNAKEIRLPINFSSIEITNHEIFTYTKNRERQLSIDKVAKFISLKQGQLIESTISNKGILTLKVECENKHKWNVNQYNLFKGKWCPYCYRKKLSQQKRIPLTELQQIATRQSGHCLTDSLKDNPQKILWECKFGHKWYAKPTKVKSGSWCPKCAGNTSGNINEVLEIIQKKGGTTNDRYYANNSSTFTIKCKEGHIFSSKAKYLKIGNWCPKCAIETRGKKKRLTIVDMQNMASNKNGECLSTEYVNDTTKLRWLCIKGHQWLAKPSNIRSGHWCPACAGKTTFES